VGRVVRNTMGKKESHWGYRQDGGARCVAD